MQFNKYFVLEKISLYETKIDWRTLVYMEGL